MNLLLCSTDKTILDRWEKFLENSYRIQKANTIGDVVKMLEDGGIDLILLHRSLVDLKFIESLHDRPYITLADIPDDREAVKILRSGALGYTNAYISASRLKEVVKAVLSGRVWIGKQLLQKIIRGTNATIEKTQEADGPREILSAREEEVAQLVSKGLSNLEIAAHLDISDRTVKAHISSIFKKTQTTSRLQLALYMKGLPSEV